MTSYTSQTFYTKSKVLTKSIDNKTSVVLGSKTGKVKLLNPIKIKQFSQDLPKVDIEFLQDENIKLKIDLHKHRQSANLAKVEMSKLEEDNRKVLVIVHDILNKSNVDAQEIHRYIQAIRNDDVLDNFTFNIAITGDQESKVKESLVNLQLKNYVFSLKKIIIELREELQYLKSNTKIGNFIKVERELTKKSDEIQKLTQCYLKLKSDNEDGETRLNSLLEENSSMKSSLEKYYALLDILKEKEKEKNQSRAVIKSIQPFSGFTSPSTKNLVIETPENKKTDDGIAQLTEQAKKDKAKINSLTRDVSNLTKEISNLKKEISDLTHSLNQVNETSKKKIAELNNQKENEKCNFKISEVEMLSKINQLTNENKGFISKLEKMDKEIKSNAKCSEELKSSVSSLENEKLNLQKVLDEQTIKIKSYEKEIDILKESLKQRDLNTTSNLYYLIIIDSKAKIVKINTGINMASESYNQTADKDGIQSNENYVYDEKEELISSTFFQTQADIKVENNTDSVNVAKKAKKQFSVIEEAENSQDENAEGEKKSPKKQSKKVEEKNSRYTADNPMLTKYSSEINQKPKYKLKIQNSEDQNINPSDTFYVIDKSADVNSFISEKKENRGPVWTRLPTLDRVLTEKIQKGEDFDNLLQDPNLKKFTEKIK